MNSTTYRLSNRSRLASSLLIGTGVVLGSLVACSSDGGNPSPTKPVVITTGGGGHGGGTIDGEAGENSEGGSAPKGGAGNGKAGGSNGGSGGRVAEDGGAGGEGGQAGEGPLGPTCPSTDLEFLNQPSSSQKTPFDNAKRLGAAAALPPLPGG